VLFLWIWKLYLSQVVLLARAHPFAWVSFGAQAGEIYPIRSYYSRFQQAAAQSGPALAGITPDTLRLAYMLRLAETGLPRPILEGAIHYAGRDLWPCIYFTDPSVETIAQALKAADRFAEPPFTLGDLSHPTDADIHAVIEALDRAERFLRVSPEIDVDWASLHETLRSHWQNR
jgi:hypothetical protein